MMAAVLPPLPVAIPLAVAGLLLAFNRLLPGRVPDVLALVAACGCAAICVLLLVQTGAHGPITYWFGGWKPQGGHVIGIAFVIGQAGALVALFASVLTALSLLFAWGFFKSVGTQFHAMMLVFLAAMVGFALTHDLFNMFVWFEAMSVTAFALTAYHLTIPSLEGALTFTVTNSLGSFFMLGGIGLLYLASGTLDFGALGQFVRAHPDSPVLAAGFCLVATALLIKGAMVPFHFWLSDAHAVAPSPLSVLFSAIMVPLGLFGVMRLVWDAFLSDPEVMFLVHHLLFWLGAATAIVGALGCVQQRHFKRLLALSTVAHMGVLIMALALVTSDGIAGFLAYLLGHGMVKGALFMVAGVLAARLGGLDEIALRGKGRKLWPAGLAGGVGALLLGGLPFGVMDEGGRLIDAAARQAGHGWLAAPLILATGLTGAAALRAVARVFVGLGPDPSPEEAATPHPPEHEPSDRPLWLMLAPALVLLIGALAFGAVVHRGAEAAAGSFLQVAGVPHGPVAVPPDLRVWVPWLSIALTLWVAAHELWRQRLPGVVRVTVDTASRPAFAVVEVLQSGTVGDYVAWIVAGLALFAAAIAFG